MANISTKYGERIATRTNCNKKIGEITKPEIIMKLLQVCVYIYIKN